MFPLFHTRVPANLFVKKYLGTLQVTGSVDGELGHDLVEGSTFDVNLKVRVEWGQTGPKLVRITKPMLVPTDAHPVGTN